MAQRTTTAARAQLQQWENSTKCKCHLVLHERRSFKFILRCISRSALFNQPTYKIFRRKREREKEREMERAREGECKVFAATAY